MEKIKEKNDFFENYEMNRELDFYNSFEDVNLGLNDSILKGIYNYGYEKPSAIQRIGIKPIIDGLDIVLQSHSGTGKTATFIIGLMQRIDEKIQKPQCIVISNTRELADQTHKVFLHLSQYTNIKANLCIGGDLQHKYNIDNLKEQVIIGTPGRISDLMSKNIIQSQNIKLVIIDEADDILTTSFSKQIKKIFSKISKESQVVLISATIPSEMAELFDTLLKPDYLKILVKDDELTLDGINQYYIELNEEYKSETLTDLYKYISIGQAIIYCNKKHKTDELKNYLTEQNYTVSVLHSDMMQKEREDVMKEFRLGTTRILITTDILSRGIDIQQISLVINYDMPKYPQTYIHRIGRSGRFGRKGVAINFITYREKSMLNVLRKMYNTEINVLPSNIDEIL